MGRISDEYEDDIFDEDEDFDEDKEWDDTIQRWYPNSSPEEIEEELADRFLKDQEKSWVKTVL